MEITNLTVPIKFGSGANFLQIGTNGHISLSGEATYFKDELGDAAALRSVGPGVAVDPLEGTQEFAYNSDLNDYLYKNVQLNHMRGLSFTIHAHIHGFQAKNYAPNLLLQYRWQGNNKAKTTAWQNLPCNTPVFTYTSGILNQIFTSTPITPPANDSLSAVVQFRIVRDNANASGAFAGADPYNTGGNASFGLTSFDVHIECDSLGSNEEYVK